MKTRKALEHLPLPFNMIHHSYVVTMIAGSVMVS